MNSFCIFHHTFLGEYFQVFYHGSFLLKKDHHYEKFNGTKKCLELAKERVNFFRIF